MKRFFGKIEDSGGLKAEYDQKLDEALSAQASGDLKKSTQLLKESQQIFLQWAAEVKGAGA